MSKSSNESGASDSSIDGGVVSVASAAKASAVVEAAATRATKAAIAPVLPVFVADVGAPAGDVASGSAPDAAADAGPAAVAQRPDGDEPVLLDEGASALEVEVAAEGASAINVGTEVDQRPDVDVDALDDGGVAAGVAEAEPVALTDGVPTGGLGAAVDERPAEDAAGAAGALAEEAIADELPGTVGRGGGFAAGGGDAAGAGRAGGTVGIAAFETGLLTGATRGVALGFETDDAGRLTPAGKPAVAPEGSWGADEADCDAGAGDWAADEPACVAAND